MNMVIKYGLEITDVKHPLLVKEDEFKYDGRNMTDPEKIVKMINKLFRLNYQAEEYVYMCSFDSKMNILGVFEVAHGNINSAPLTPREVAIRALITGATGVVVLHNHPSMDCTPSISDKEAFKRLDQGLKIIGIALHDFIVVGEKFYSFTEHNE